MLISRRMAGFLLLPLTMAGCSSDPSGNYLYGIGDPVRGAALYAPQNFGDTAKWQGRPVEAAMAVEQLEFLTNELATSPRYAPAISPTVLQRLQAARAEMRQALGIAPDATPEVVMTSMRRTADALKGGSRAQAEAALSSSAFPAGPMVMLTRLNTLPHLPRCAEAASVVAAEFSNASRSSRL